ncbi:MAG: glycerophosphodiester phosphodiesterase [Clostridia bacterium]|nr:glycerophosphodiester phosphodiesterase [Clostridia bacterium]
MILLILLAAVALLLLFMIAPRLTHPAQMRGLQKARFAHRGLHNIKIGVPENSMLAFSLAVKEGFGIELDVHLSKDGKLVVEHDDTLQRTAGVPLVIEKCDWTEIKDLTLEGTEEKLPLLTDVFKLVNGKVPLLIEMKAVGSNQKALAEAVVRALETYQGPYCVESFDPRALYWLRKFAPDIVRGQLAGNVNKKKRTVHPAVNFALSNLLVNVLSRPDFVAYNYKDRRNISFRLCRTLYRPPVFFWTVKTAEGENIAADAKATPIFERLDTLHDSIQ